MGSQQCAAVSCYQRAASIFSIKMSSNRTESSYAGRCHLLCSQNRGEPSTQCCPV